MPLLIADGSGSAAREAGISLLDERHHRFDRVGGRELVRLADAFSLQCLFKVEVNDWLSSFLLVAAQSVAQP